MSFIAHNWPPEKNQEIKKNRDKKLIKKDWDKWGV